jgi:hypothetical protein
VLELGYEPSTQVLREQGNHIGDAGAAALARALLDNRRLTALDLLRNGVTSEGARAFVDALSVNRTLTSLTLGKGIGEGSRKELRRLLERNRELAQAAAADGSEADVLAIRSVYRTARKE